LSNTHLTGACFFSDCAARYVFRPIFRRRPRNRPEPGAPVNVTGNKTARAGRGAGCSGTSPASRPIKTVATARPVAFSVQNQNFPPCFFACFRTVKNSRLVSARRFIRFIRIFPLSFIPQVLRNFSKVLNIFLILKLTGVAKN
jgi:hypothetical protein